MLEGIKYGKFVFCEKPLAPTSKECRRIVDAEMAGGKQLVQVGFMRRFDTGYRQVKKVIEEKTLGEPLVVHCCHRNADTIDDFTTEMVVENAMIHEIDVLRWILEEDFATAQVILPKKAASARAELHDPQILILSTKSGVHIDLDVFMRAEYGYDIRCEICCDRGSVSLPQPSSPILSKEFRRSTTIAADWSVRFADAYNLEFQEWINATKQGIVSGPSAWDGYVASVTTAAGSRSRETGTIVAIELDECPDFYKK